MPTFTDMQGTRWSTAGVAAVNSARDTMRPDPPEYSLRDHAQPGALPLRPLTTGELLDAAVALLRTRAGLLLGAGFLAALAEQAVLFPLRRAADVDASYLPGDDRLWRSSAC